MLVVSACVPSLALNHSRARPHQFHPVLTERRCGATKKQPEDTKKQDEKADLSKKHRERTLPCQPWTTITQKQVCY
ncbi:Hypp7068 [Branchiostoma lanceolatum]|uniref:Hypp7068 protein n=1 Tax=Branchiostoma lanceolatum TaxID=7740 RepID=A0A8J9YWZ2_BRALA|nr:Hypp7068 [Branchiostoma lanceolatum]